MSTHSWTCVIDELNTYGCTIKTLRKRVLRAIEAGHLETKEIAEELGCSEWMVRDWKRRLKR